MKHHSTRRAFLRTTTFGLTASLTMPCLTADQAVKQPNIVVIFLDDSGFADFSPFGNPTYPAPNVNKLATEGCRFTNFHVPQTICSASHGALLSGCYPEQTQPAGAIGSTARGRDPQWPPIVQILKQQGYTSAIFGKWHIGEQRNLTRWSTEHAIDFIKCQGGHPFFLYVPHSMPHRSLSVSKEFENKSGEGLYADVMMEWDWSVGQIMAALQKSGVEDNTLVIFTSNNGPWIDYGDHAGKRPYNESKGTSFDGGTRCACIMKMPGRIKAGTTSDGFFCSSDLMPTFAALAGAERPASPFDGRSVLDIITA